MMNLRDLQAIANGEDPVLVECVGGSILLDEGANVQALKLRMSKPMKEARLDMKAAKKPMKELDYTKAEKDFNSAIKNLKELQKAAEDIDDDHIVMTAVDTFVKGFIPLFVSTTFYNYTGLIGQSIATIASVILGLSKTFDYSAALSKGFVEPNKAGRNGSADPSVWWKTGQTRGAVMTRLDRMITECEKALDAIKKSK